MSINMVFGLPGGGKTTFLAKKAKKALKRGERVYTNFEFKGAYKLDFNDLGVHDYSDCTILIDEISLLCDSRNWKEFGANLVYFFSHHRKYGVTVWACSQSFRDCDVKIRNLTDHLYYIKCLPFGFSSVRVIQKVFDVDGEITEGYNLSGFPELVYRPRYYKYFDSYERRPLPPNEAQPW